MARSLRGRLALWIFVSTAVSLAVFAIVAYIAVVMEEREEIEAGVQDTPEEVAADAREQVLLAMAFAAPIGLGLCTLGALWASRRTLAPIERVIATASEITVQRLDRRIDAPAKDDELRRLAVALNELLDRLERGYNELAAFAAEASHELRTPLAAVCSELEVALRRPRSAEEWTSSARTSLGELRRLSRVIDALLRFAQADASDGRDDERLDVADWLADVVAMHATAAHDAGVEIAVHADEPAAIKGDLDMLSSAAGNVIGNAIRYTPRGGTIDVTARIRGDRVAIVIDDSGPGLDRDELDAIFAPFARGSLAGDRDGIGLGLPIARRIVERHGGSIAATNRPEGGARFTIELPLHADCSVS